MAYLSMLVCHGNFCYTFLSAVFPFHHHIYYHISVLAVNSFDGTMVTRTVMAELSNSDRGKESENSVFNFLILFQSIHNICLITNEMDWYMVSNIDFHRVYTMFQTPFHDQVYTENLGTMHSVHRPDQYPVLPSTVVSRQKTYSTMPEFWQTSHSILLPIILHLVH